MGRYVFIMKTDLIRGGYFEWYAVGVIQGLIYGMCAIPCNTVLYDCEKFTNLVIFPVDTTEEHCEECLKLINQKWPGICHYKKREEL